MSRSYACLYTTLADYNSSQSAQNMTQSGIKVPEAAGTPSMRIQTVPVWGGPSYEALTHEGRCNCGGHFTISDAYPNYGNNCTKFTKRLCSPEDQ